MRPALALVALCGLAGVAHADRADQLFKKGQKLLAEKRYAEACAAFEDSDRLDPEIGAKLNIARCYQEWGKLATAYRWFADAEQVAERAKDERAKRIHELIEELDPSVPRLTINAPRDANTAGIVIRLDGVELPAGALGVERRVDPGPHQIDAIVDGEKQTKVVPVERGASSDVTLELPVRRLAGRAPAQPTREPASVADPYQRRRYIGLGTAGAGVVAIGIGEIVALRARGDYNRAISGHCNGAGDQCDADGLARTHSARHRANIATFVTLGGLVAVAGGAFLYFTAPHAAVASDDHALYVAPSVGDANGLVLGGAF
jgi:tetratricopeptide (TPR) repeat protein